MTFRISITLFLCSLLTACGGSSNSNQAAEVSAYDATGIYAASLKRCVYDGDNTEECTLASLPFIGQETIAPSIDDIMSRVLVSHTWMGENFASVLETLPSDLILLFRSVTAIVIASDIRPSYYSSATGAIYLDPDFLWLNPDQYSQVSKQQDFRSNFGDALQFSILWRYVENNQNVLANAFANPFRSIDDLRYPLAFLLYHELAHAVDFMPPSRFNSLSAQDTARAVLNQPSFLLSSTFTDAFPLQSSTLLDLARVSFFGQTATASQQQITASDLIGEFSNDGAIAYYSYSTPREDFANLYETAMMSYHFGIEKDVALTNNPPNPSSGDDYIVSWGQRGRISDPNVIERAVSVINAAYPELASDVEAHLRSLPAPQPLNANMTWNQNLSPNNPASPGSSKTSVSKPERVLTLPIDKPL